MKSKRILVTGGAGFIGSHLVDELIQRSYEVVVIDNLSTGKKKNLNKKAKFFKFNICNPKLSQIFKKEKLGVVFHYAAQIDVRKSVEDPVGDANLNILGTLNVLENCKKYKVKKIILASTGGAIYGDAKIIPTPEDYPEWPLSPYGIEKLALEKYLNYYQKVFNLPFVALRLANVYGPRQNSKGEAGVVAIFCDKMMGKKKAAINGNGRQTRDFVYVDDVVEANILALEKDKTGIFNIGTAKETNINTIFRKLKKLTNSVCKEVHGPARLGEQRRSCLDYSKAKKKLGWKPNHNLEEGLKKTIEWFRYS
ncbi:MAG: NAD-dependent epimerase/dehydratase family protein [Candidatus Nealsonbacteria bacterium]